MENLVVKIQMKKGSELGFTLIELLVVIAVIGLLASIILVSLNTARAKSRDAKRRSDLNQLRTALELYYSNHGNYPISGSDPINHTWYGVTSMHDSTYVQLSGPLGWIPDLAPEAIPVLPKDPRDFGIDTGYHYNSNGTDYKLLAFQTTESICPIPPSDGMYDPMRNPVTAWGPTVPCTFAVYTPGAVGW